MNKDGILLCGKYAASPNFFGYCGPHKSASILDHLKEGIADHEMIQILSEFETLYPYLILISKVNRIKDPYDKQVVEAYWIGNVLLNQVAKKDYLIFLDELFSLEKKTDRKTARRIKSRILTLPAFPHHTFHVFNIFKQMRNNLGYEAIQTMDNCRISWGKVVDKNTARGSVYVMTNPLVLQKSKIGFGENSTKEIRLDYKNKRFINNIKPGSWISCHWGYICDILTARQRANIEYYTKRAIDFYNF